MANVHSGSGSVTAQIPDEFKGLAQGAGQQGQQLQSILPLGLFSGYNPRDIADLGNLTKYGLEDVSSLRQVQPGTLGAMASLATMPEIASRPVDTPGAENAQYDQLAQLTGGPIGSSPATQAVMADWKQNALPVVQNEAANMGLGRSGAALDAVTKSFSSAYMPAVQQEISNRMNSISLLQSMADAQTQRGLEPRTETLQALGTAADEMRQLSQMQYEQQLQAIEEAFKGGQITSDKQQQLNDAAYDEFLRLQDMSQSVTTGLFSSIIPASIGSRQSSGSTGFGLTK